MKNTMKKIIAITLTLIMTFSCFSLVSFAGEPETGEHLTKVPEGYVGIYTKYDLDNIRKNLNGKYILMNDIYFEDSDFEENGDFFNDGMGWVPIGGVFDKWSAYYYEFTGDFNGNGYSINNLQMDRKPTSYSAYPSTSVTTPGGTTITYYSTHAFGLFVENAGTIENLNIFVDYRIDANPYAVAGGFCGINSGLMSNCKAHGTIFAEKAVGSGDSCFGGIAGLIDGGTITNCANYIDISGSNPYDFPYLNCGGIIGGSDGKGTNVISCCYNAGDITPETASASYLAGIAARASGFGLYSEGYSLTIENCYNAGTIGNENVDGKVAGICGEGYHENTNLINCYNVGSIISSNKSAGIVIEYNRSTNCYYLNSSADCLWYSYGTGYIINDLYDSQMKTEKAFIGFNFDDVWIVDASSEYPYPQLRNNLQSEKIPVEHDYSEIILVDATCTKLGLKKLFCSKCGFSFDVVIDKSATHTYLSEITIPATHLTTGVMTYTCECGDTYTEVIENTTDHTYDEVVTEPNCTEQGYTTYTCACGDTYIDDYIDALGHNYSSEITTPATHLTEGVETYTCECGDTYTEVIAKITEHTYNAVITLPTCEDEGYTTYTCECGDSYKSDYTSANGHTSTTPVEENYVAPTCTENGSKDIVVCCTVCEEEISRETVVIEATGHADNDGDGYCDTDNELLDPTVECNCSCHKSGITKFFFNFILFFQRLFGSNKTCACGVAHH